jgi:hypothetical protein
MSYAPGALPSAREFWTKHVGGSKPAFFPGLGRTHPAFTRWRSDEALARAFGEFQVQVEPAVEQRLSEHCARQVQDEATGRLEWVDSRSVRPPHRVPCPASLDVFAENDVQMPLAEFLGRGRSERLYMITQAPRAMNQDVLVPSFAQCGWREPLARPADTPWMTQLYEANVWMSFNAPFVGASTTHNFSSGPPFRFSKSLLHYDQNHGFMCVMSGRKEWLLIDTAAHHADVPLWEENFDAAAPHKSRASDDSLIDGEFVDLVKYPRFANVKMQRAVLSAGDCVWTPAKWLHYVRSWGRNIGSMWMLQDDPEEHYYSEESCRVLPPNMSGVPLAAHDLMWDFPGSSSSTEPEWGVIKMGFEPWTVTRRRVAEQLDAHEPEASWDVWRQHFGSDPAVMAAFRALLRTDARLLTSADLYSSDAARVFRRLVCEQDHGGGCERPERHEHQEL